MATVYRKKIIRPMPDGAQIVAQRGRQFACWYDGRGQRRMAEIAVGRDGVVRIATRTATYYARYRDGNGRRQDVPTGCRDETAARAVLADLVRRSELVKANVITPREDVIAGHQDTPLLEHMETWLAHLEAKGVTPGRVKTNRERFTQVAGDCDWARLTDLDGPDLERWMVEKAKKGTSAGSRNGYREACVAFANWAVRAKRLGETPFAHVPKADTTVDCRRKSRALTEDELARLLDATRRQPLLERMIIRPGEEQGQAAGQGQAANTGATRASRPGTGADLQDAGPDGPAEERTGVDHRGPARARWPASARRSARGRREEPARLEDPATGGSGRRHP